MSGIQAIPYIIVQASGLGNRLRHLTQNKPKALLSLFAEPLLIRTMRLYPLSHFLILGHYQFPVLKAYLQKFAPHQNLTLIKTKGSTLGNNVGIKTALNHIPPHTPFMITWCDLLHLKPIRFTSLNLLKENYLGLAGSFPCRWQYRYGKLKEKTSRQFGVAGIFVFKDKFCLTSIPPQGELCQYLQTINPNFIPFTLSDIKEVGTLRSYSQILNSQPLSRPFNFLKINQKTVTKLPTTTQGTKLARHESNWYQTFRSQKWDFLPKVFQYFPLRLKLITGQSLHLQSLTNFDKKRTLLQIINHLNTIHQSFPSKNKNFYNNNMEEYLSKTKKRLDSVASLIPHIHNSFININGQRCLNYYQSWNKLEKLIKPLFSDTYTPIHGDCTFSNTIYDPSKKKIYLIDPRGYFGREKIWGDPDYDWTKLYYSLLGNYDQFNQKNFKLKIEKKQVSLKIKSNGYQSFAPLFFQLTQSNPQKIKLLHAIIWLSLTAYSWDDYDAVCAAFYQGIYLLNQP